MRPKIRNPLVAEAMIAAWTDGDDGVEYTLPEYLGWTWHELSDYIEKGETPE